MRRRVAILLSALTVAYAAAVVVTPAAAGQPERTYVIKNAKSFDDDLRIRGTGVVVDGYEHSNLYVKAKPAQVTALRKLGFKVEAMGVTVSSTPVDPGYTDFDEMKAEVDRIV